MSFFIWPMALPGISTEPIVDMTTAHSFNQVYFDDVRVPADGLVGRENDGWRLAKATLGNERVSLSTGGALWGSGPTVEDLLTAVRAGGGVDDARLRQRLAPLYIHREVLPLIRLRTVAAPPARQEPGPPAAPQELLPHQ